MNDSLASQIDRERNARLAAATDEQGLVHPTEEEARNGWTPETLTAYLAERTAGQAMSIDQDSLQRRMARRPKSQNDRYNPHRWR